MHKISKKTCLLLMALLTSSILAALPVKGSGGNILINTTTAPSAVAVVQIGGSVNLYFGKVTWSGGTIVLYLSKNGYAVITEGEDIPYGPADQATGGTFSVAILKTAAVDTTTYPGYSVGYDWINGTIPKTLEICGGNYYVKAFDGTTAAVASTDNYITITALFEVVPDSGPGQAAISLEVYAGPCGGHVNFSHTAGAGGVIATLVPVGDNGRVTYPTIAPDLLEVVTPAGNQSEQSSTFTFIMTPSAGSALTFLWTQYARGLLQVKGSVNSWSGSGYLYGNQTNFCSLDNNNVTVMGSLIIAGKYFHPGSLTILWDGTTVLGTTTANATGHFNTTIEVPITSMGTHYVIIDDGKIEFQLYICVIPTLILTPDEGVPCTSLTVTAVGYGFPATTSSILYSVDLLWWYASYCDPANTTVVDDFPIDANGHFVTTFLLPHSVGGVKTVYAVANDTAPGTTGKATFTVLVGIKITPNVFPNNGTIVTVSGCGLENGTYYNLLIDNNKDFYAEYGSWASYFVGDCIGDFEIQLVAAGFDDSLDNHVVAIYKSNGLQLPDLVAHALFVVTSTEETTIIDKLNEILANLADVNATVLAIDGNVVTIKTDVGTITGDIATIQTDVALIKTDVATAAANASSAKTSAETAASASTDAKTAAEAVQAAVAGITTAVYGAIVLSLIAALASIIAVITLQKKVAG